jgi:ATP phosphoribosyltransferase
MKPVTVALAKGRLAGDAAAILEKCGVDCSALFDSGRRLVVEDARSGVSFILVKPFDVPTYVERGVADLGVVGKDTLMERNARVYEMLDLGFGRCRLCVAGFPEQRDRAVTALNLRVATKYPRIARSYYGEKGVAIDIIELNGSVELGPLVGLSDVILDIVESGRTLEENGLVVLEKICDVSARLIVNRVSLKTKGDRIKPLLAAMRKALTEENGK